MGGVATLQDGSRVNLNGGLWAPGSVSCTVIGAQAAVRIGSSLTVEGGVSSFRDRPYDIYDETGAPGGSFSPYDLLINVGASYRIGKSLETGVSIKSVTSGIAENATGSAFCADIHAAYTGRGWYGGLAVRNLGPAVNYGSGAYPLPALAAVYGGWKPLDSLSIVAEADYLFAGAFMAGAGVEYAFRDMLFARAGYHYGDAARALPGFLSLGLGGKLAGFSLDASVLLLSDTLSASFLIGLGYSF